VDAIVSAAVNSATHPRGGCRATIFTAEDRRIHAALIFDLPNEQRVRDGKRLFFNFRADRARQLSQAFLLKDFDGFDREVWPQVHFVSLTQYDVRYSSPFIFAPQELKHILARSSAPPVNGNCGSRDREIRACDLLFNSGVEKPFPAKTVNLFLAKSCHVRLKPEMSAFEVSDEVLSSMADYDLII